MEIEISKEEEELEEGEVPSDDEENPVESNTEIAEDYELIQRPVSWTETLKKQGQDGSCRTMGVTTYKHQPSRPHRPGPFASKAQNNDDDDEYYDGLISNSSSESSDISDDDGPTGKKSKRMGDTGHFKPVQGIPSATPSWSSWTTSKPFNASEGINENLVFNNQAEMFQQKRKPNNIWSKVLQEEEVSDIFGKVNVQEVNGRDLVIDRGPESFSIKYHERSSVCRRSDSSSLSSGGLTDNELEFLRGKSLEGDASIDHSSDFIDVSNVVEQYGRRAKKRKMHCNSKKRRQRKKQKRTMVKRLKKMDPKLLGQYMANKLSEPKVHIINNAIEFLGKDEIISLFLKTMKIERRGGLMIMNQQRRRTAGGVFFYLLRGDKRYPVSLIDQVFQVDRQIQLQCKKNYYSRKRLVRKAKLEARKREEEQKDGDKKNDLESDDQIAFKVNPDDMEEEDNSDNDSLPGGQEEESDVDSDEFYGIQNEESNSAGPSRQLIDYQIDDDLLDIHCDPSDLISN